MKRYKVYRNAPNPGGGTRPGPLQFKIVELPNDVLPLRGEEVPTTTATTEEWSDVVEIAPVQGEEN